MPDERSGAITFVCPGCGEEELPDEAGVVTCECGAHIETLEPLGMRRILPNFWTRLRGSAAPPIPPTDETAHDGRVWWWPW
jgi:hypothetical protein